MLLCYAYIYNILYILYIYIIYIWWFPEMGVPNLAGWFIRENPTKMDNFGGLFHGKSLL